MKIPSKSFVFLIFAVALSIELIGTIVSVIGLGEFFSYDKIILAMIMILDIAKISSLSLLYQYWDRLKIAMNSYLLIAVVVLMVITSTGTFAYLSSAFQRAMLPSQAVELQVNLLNKEKQELTLEREQLSNQKSNIDRQIAQLPIENVKGRRQLINSFKPEVENISSRTLTISKRLDELQVEISKVESSNIEQKVHVGPIHYVANMFKVSAEEASKWIILMIVFVFDPLAMVLVIGGNFLINLRSNSKENTPTVKSNNESIIDDNEIPEEISMEPLRDAVRKYVPVDPDLIKNFLTEKSTDIKEDFNKEEPVEEEILKSSLTDLKVNFPEALFDRLEKSVSARRPIYSK